VNWPITRPLRRRAGRKSLLKSPRMAYISPDAWPAQRGQSKKQRAKAGGDQDEYEDPPIRLKRNYAKHLSVLQSTL